MWSLLVQKILGGLEMTGVKSLIHQLEHFVAPYAVKDISGAVGDLLVEGVNAAVAAAVNTLDKDKAGDFAHGYVAEIEHDLLALTQALTEYVPLQVAVEDAIKQFGSGSKEANAAIDTRNAGVDAIKTDIAGLFTHMVKI